MTERDLFGPVPAAVPKVRDSTPVQVRLELLQTTGPGLLLAPAGKGQAGQWAPAALLSRGEGPEENVWTMPRWLARERGWL